MATETKPDSLAYVEISIEGTSQVHLVGTGGDMGSCQRTTLCSEFFTTEDIRRVQYVEVDYPKTSLSGQPLCPECAARREASGRSVPVAS